MKKGPKKVVCFTSLGRGMGTKHLQEMIISRLVSIDSAYRY